jgi:iron complex transport system ATP-binding protein
LKSWKRGQTDEVEASETKTSRPLPLLTADGVRVHPRGADSPILNVGRFEIHPSRVHGIIGPNGSGKTTLLKVIARVWEEPVEAGLKWHDQLAHRDSQLSWARRVVYLGSSLSTSFPLSAWDYVWLGRRTARIKGGIQPTGEDQEAIHAAMDRCACWGLRARELSSLSNGEQQRVLLARGLAQNPKVLILDETLTMLDLHQQQSLGESLRAWCKENGAGVVMVSHDLNLALRLSDEVSLLQNGAMKGLARPIDELAAEDLKPLFPKVDLQRIEHAGGVRFLY